MGLVASQARLLFLTARQSDLEFQMQKISQKRMNLSAQMQNIYNQQAMGGCGGSGSWWSQNGSSVLNLCLGETVGGLVDSVCGMFGGSDSGNSAQDQQNAMLSSLQEQDKCMEMMINTYETQHKAVSTEYDSVKKIIENNIKKSFKYV